MVDVIEPQPDPEDDVGGINVWDVVIADMIARDQFGKRKYGKRLKVNDGRDALVDAYQEMLDAVVYLRKEIIRREMERDAKARA